MKIDGISFNQQWSWGKTQDEFVKEFKDMDHIYPDVDDKVAKLKEAHTLLQKGKPADFKAPKGPVVIASNDLVKENIPPEPSQPAVLAPSGVKQPDTSGKPA